MNKQTRVFLKRLRQKRNKAIKKRVRIDKWIGIAKKISKIKEESLKNGTDKKV